MAYRKRKPGVNTNNNKKEEKRRSGSFFGDDRFRFSIGLIFLVFASFLLVAFISFLFFVSFDQSKLEMKWTELIMNREIRVDNKAGKTGAFLAEIFINRGFGLASFIFVYVIIALGLRIMGRKLGRVSRNLAVSLIAIIWLSITLGYLFMKSNAGAYLYMGGNYGFIMSQWLNSFVGKAGTFLLVFVSGFIIVISVFKGSLPWMKEKVAKLFEHRTKPVYVDEEEQGKTGKTVNLTDSSFSKVIEDGNVVKAIFDPDKLEILDNTNPEAVDTTNRNLSQSKIPEPELTVDDSDDEDEGDLSEIQDMDEYDPTLELSKYKFPGLDLLADHHAVNAQVSNEELISNKNKIVETLRNYKIEITKIRATIGPTVTLYEIVPAPGIRIAKIKNLEDDIALSLAALGIRIIAPIPGRGTIGIEVPNQNPEVVSMKSILSSAKFTESTAELPIALGKTISNETFVIDLAKMPHILVAGATGQGKSVGLNVIIACLLYRLHPSQLKFIFVDPKKVELNLYSVIEKHYLAKLPDDDEPIITDIHKVKNVLNSVNIEMANRYDLLKKAHARNAKEYNDKFIARKLNPHKGHRYMPYIVVVIDEFADLIMTAGKEIEFPIARIAQLARAVGIHMIIATQRPSTNIITGVIKANFPARIAFKVASMIDSRTILDHPGANQLIGKGDMLISTGSTMTRLQCALIDTPEVEAICNHIAGQQGYPSAFMLPEVADEETGVSETDLGDKDELFDEVARFVVMNQMGSTSMIQRKYSIGYNRAGRIMDQMAAAGIVGPSEGSKARQVLIQDDYSLEHILKSFN